MVGIITIHDVLKFQIENEPDNMFEFDICCVVLNSPCNGEAFIADIHDLKQGKYCTVVGIEEEYLTPKTDRRNGERSIWRKGSLIQLHARVHEYSPVLKLIYLDDYDGKFPYLPIDQYTPFANDRYKNYELTIRDFDNQNFFRLFQADIDAIVEFVVISLENAVNYQVRVTDVHGALGQNQHKFKSVIVDYEHIYDMSIERGQVFNMIGIITDIYPLVKIKLIKKSKCNIDHHPIEKMTPITWNSNASSHSQQITKWLCKLPTESIDTIQPLSPISGDLEFDV